MKPITLFVPATELNSSAQSLFFTGFTLSLRFTLPPGVALPAKAASASLFCSELLFCSGGNALRFASLYGFALPQGANPCDPQWRSPHFWGSQRPATLDDCVELPGEAHESKGGNAADRVASLVSDLLLPGQLAYKRWIRAAMETAIDKMSATRWSTAGSSGLCFGSFSIPLSF